MSEQWMIALDTDSYVGNFERKLCAYATGFIGDCGVGRREQEQFEDAVGPQRM